MGKCYLEAKIINEGKFLQYEVYLIYYSPPFENTSIEFENLEKAKEFILYKVKRNKLLLKEHVLTRKEENEFMIYKAIGYGYQCPEILLVESIIGIGDF